MSVKSNAFDILNEWELLYGDIHECRSEAALDLADELEISIDDAQVLIDKWLVTNRRNGFHGAN